MSTQISDKVKINTDGELMLVGEGRDLNVKC